MKLNKTAETVISQPFNKVNHSGQLHLNRNLIYHGKFHDMTYEEEKRKLRVYIMLVCVRGREKEILETKERETKRENKRKTQVT